MSKAPKVSLIAISYNQERYINQAFESFLAQKTKFAFEILIGDDCSTDNTKAIIEKYTTDYPELFKLVPRDKNIGLQRNFIDALQKASGEYVIVCECDDYFTDPQKLQLQADFLDRNPDCALCFHPVKVVFENGEKEDFITPTPQDPSTFTVSRLVKDNFMQTNSVMYRRQNYDQMATDILPFDWYLHLYHARFGKIGFIDRVMAVYRRHTAGVWWGSHDNIDTVLLKHGVEWLGLYVEARELYKNNKQDREILNGSIITMFNQLAAIDKTHKTHLVRQGVAKYSKAAELYINDLLKQAKNLDDHSKEQAKIIDHYVNLNKSLQDVEEENQKLKAKRLLRLESALKNRVKRLKG